MPIIEVNHVTKEYQLGQLESLKRMFLRVAARLRGSEVAARPLFKALDDVDSKRLRRHFSRNPKWIPPIPGANVCRQLCLRRPAASYVHSGSRDAQRHRSHND
jgi:hypothetical protein